MNFIKVWGFSASIFLVACGGSQSSDGVKTSDIYVEFEISKSAGAEVLAKLKDKSGTYIQLTSDDTLWIETNTQRTVIENKGILFPMNEYYIPVGFEDVQNALFTVSFIRKGHKSATNSTVILPAPVTINMPVDNSEFSRGSDISLDWESSEDGEMEITMHTLCTREETMTDHIEESRMVYNDFSGVAVFPLSEAIRVFDGPCIHTFIFHRIKKGTVDPAFAGGYIHGIRNQAISVITVNE